MQPGLLSSEIRDATANGTYAPAFEAARALESLPVEQGLETVLSAAKGDLVTYDALAVRWIALMIEQHQLTLYDVYWVACRLREQAETLHDSSQALRRLLEKRRIERDELGR